MPDVVSDFVCTGCGLMCDDLRLTVEANRVVALDPPCPLAESTLLAEATAVSDASCTVDGRPAELSAAIERAGELLSAAKAPLVAGFAHATVEAQRLAIEIADRVGGFADPGLGERPTLPPDGAGPSTATFGEALAHCDLAVLLACDPEAEAPRLLPRFRRQPAVLVVAAVEELMAERERLAAARFPCVFYGDDLATQDLVQLTNFVREQHQRGRAAALRITRGGNGTGATAALSWLTGFPQAVSFAAGLPRPWDGGDPDVTLIIAGNQPVPEQRVPTIILAENRAAADSRAEVVIPVARLATETSGTVFRADGVALPLKRAVAGPWSTTTEVLEQILSRLATRPLPTKSHA